MDVRLDLDEEEDELEEEYVTSQTVAVSCPCGCAGGSFPGTGGRDVGIVSLTFAIEQHPWARQLAESDPGVRGRAQDDRGQQSDQQVPPRWHTSRDVCGSTD